MRGVASEYTLTQNCANALKSLKHKGRNGLIFPRRPPLR